MHDGGQEAGGNLNRLLAGLYPNLKIQYRKLKFWLMRCRIFFLGRFHGVEDKVLFESFSGGQYSDNPRSISEKLHELYPGIGIAWILKDGVAAKAGVPDYVKVIHKSSREEFKEKASAAAL